MRAAALPGLGAHRPAHREDNADDRRAHRLLRRVDPRAQRHRHPRRRRRRRVASSTWPSPPAARRWPRPASTPADVDLVAARHLLDARPAARRRRRGRLAASAPATPARSTSAPAAPASPTRVGARRRHRARRQRRARPRHRLREAHRHGRPRRPRHRVPVRRRRRRGRRQRRRASDGIGPVVWAQRRRPGRRAAHRRLPAACCRWRAGRSTAGPPPPLPDLARAACARAGIELADLAAFVPAPGQPAHHRVAS